MSGINPDDFVRMGDEHSAWVQLCRELEEGRGLFATHPNLDNNVYKPFFAAVKRWGERLVLLRQFQAEEVVVKARGEAEMAYDQLRTIPEVEL